MIATRMMCSGCSATQPDTVKIQANTNKVKFQLEEKESKKYPTFKATEFKSQLVMGTNYFIKFKLKWWLYTHSTIWKSPTWKQAFGLACLSDQNQAWWADLFLVLDFELNLHSYDLCHMFIKEGHPYTMPLLMEGVFCTNLVSLLLTLIAWFSSQSMILIKLFSKRA